MKRILRIPRFTKDSKTKALELLIDDAIVNDKGFPQEARFLLVIDDGENRVAFQLSQSEAALLYHRLGYALNEATKQYVDLEERSRKEYQKKKGKSEGQGKGGGQREEEEEEENLYFDEDVEDSHFSEESQ
ncbi:MAG: hypothetical protein ASUL_02824 [Candidatus Aramenus sulfurataquae]|jgi:hypothetical protein|uniref:Uncharacterized protein n=2 Tax=Candidatus Aramenus sulfurataquae TaxID=1326980 RepID=W7KYU1_9CREN|nr:MAG: hypothetical protein ASUL_02824 [Candidatus Aramenus sulfurataquae]MCL7344827.1 hypothetical protein [Candidatus Aramenus sulfurataquae]